MSESKKEKKNLREKMYRKFSFYEVPEFEKRIRGYDTEAVDHYLEALVDAYTTMYREYEALQKTADEYGQFKAKVADVLADILAERGTAAPPGQGAWYM